MTAESAPILRLDLSSPVPPYEQLREQLAGLISTGVLAGGTRLPPVRQLAADLGLAGGTIARAYRELEQAGLITGQGRRGTFVCAKTESGQEEQARYQALSTAADNLAATARQLGLTDDAALAALRTALAQHSV
ncbi:GntR family transcriptional regulator [Actinospica robiniae]|uniref:GntR family transcriptional regulator n=1 Tax=Actinospica robiniae TaxID=304901 RepID=UPI000422A44E|nr:GntR family transcriptional regulator [Actinospica robiniae]